MTIEKEGNLNIDVDTKTYLQMLVSNKSDIYKSFNVVVESMLWRDKAREGARRNGGRLTD